MIKKINNLFGEENIDTVDIQLPDRKKIKSAKALLDRLYTKSDLVEIYKAFRKWTEGYALQMVDESGQSASQSFITALKSSKLQNYKDTYTDFLGSILADDRNLEMYFKLMPEKSRNFFREVIYNGCINYRDAKNYGIRRRSNGYSYSYDSVLGGEFAWLTLTNFGNYYYSNTETRSYVLFPSSICRFFMPILMPEVYKPVPEMPKLPDDDWAFTNFEHEAFRDIQLVEGMFSQGIITLGKTKLLTASTEKKIDQIGMQDFPLYYTSANVRGRMITGYIAYMLRESVDGFDGASLSIEQQAYKLVRNFPVDDSGWFQILVPFVTGIKKSIVNTSNVRDILRYVVSCLFTFASKGWIPVDGIFEHMYSNLLRSGNDTFAFMPDSYNIDQLPDNIYNAVNIKPDKIIDNLTKPIVRGFLYLLASWGLLETAAKPVAKREFSPYDGLQYVRVTALGRYAMGLDKKYEAPKVENKIWFELDDERLIFRSLSEDNPYIVILKDVSNSIGGGRYEVTAESFLSHCSTRADVEQKIGIFKQYIGRELPQVWKDFFAEMLRHCQPLEKLPITNYKMYRVSKDNVSLQRLLTTDEKLRSLVIRAEGYRILVSKNDMTKFENRLKSFGYLL